MLKHNERGFTLLELLITIFIVFLLAGFGLNSLVAYRNAQRLDHKVQGITGLLRTAQEKSINQENSARWGVSFFNSDSVKDSFSLFQVDEVLYASSSYTQVPGTVMDQISLPAGVDFADPVSGDRENVVFNKFTGLLSTSFTIIIQGSGGVSDQRSIIIDSSGKIDNE